MEFQLQPEITNAPSDRWRQTLVAAWREHRLETISLQSRRSGLKPMQDAPLRDDDRA
ncbi:hypothetical protein [Asaia astilbis]|uniref:hypothetical protein n=1 Tax=Asaia astilbis TaxID=610244 RepID=UPI000A6BC365|nr:hypothetical protein [Asaia astilbis]